MLPGEHPQGIQRAPGTHDGPGHEARENDIMIDTHADSRHPAASGALSRRAFLGPAASLGAALADTPDGEEKLFLIGLEEHFATHVPQRRRCPRR